MGILTRRIIITVEREKLLLRTSEGASEARSTVKINIVMETKTKDVKPENGSRVIIKFGDDVHVGKYKENDTFNGKNTPTVRINYNNAYVPWFSVSQWVYVDEVFEK